MASLFDIAAGLSQYGDTNTPTGSIGRRVQTPSSQSALGILDETFETIYGARQYRLASSLPPFSRSMSLSHLESSRLSDSKSSEALDTRLKRLTSFKSAAAPRRMAPAIAVAGLIIPPPPAVPPPLDKPSKQNSVDSNPDLIAKKLLREVSDEIDQVAATNTGSAEEEASLIRMLSDKYIHARLDKLAGTPFVLLVRKKVAQKLEQLEQRLRARRSADNLVAVKGVKEELSRNNNNSNNNNDRCTNSVGASDSVATWKYLQKLSPGQHDMLKNLLRLPNDQLLKLPKAQVELVQFAKRYDKLLKATPNDLRHLPLDHQNLVRNIQKQQIECTPERR